MPIQLGQMVQNDVKAQEVVDAAEGEGARMLRAARTYTTKNKGLEVSTHQTTYKCRHLSFPADVIYYAPELNALSRATLFPPDTLYYGGRPEIHTTAWDNCILLTTNSTSHWSSMCLVLDASQT